MLQACIAVFGLAAMLLALDEDPRLREFAPFVGIVGQPFWLWFVFDTYQQHVPVEGIAFITIAWTFVYARACLRQLRKWRRHA